MPSDGPLGCGVGGILPWLVTKAIVGSVSLPPRAVRRASVAAGPPGSPAPPAPRAERAQPWKRGDTRGGPARGHPRCPAGDQLGMVGGATGAAAMLGLKRTTLQARMQKLGIAP